MLKCHLLSCLFLASCIMASDVEISEWDIFNGAFKISGGISKERVEDLNKNLKEIGVGSISPGSDPLPHYYSTPPRPAGTEMFEDGKFEAYPVSDSIKSPKGKKIKRKWDPFSYDSNSDSEERVDGRNKHFEEIGLAYIPRESYPFLIYYSTPPRTEMVEDGKPEAYSVTDSMNSSKGEIKLCYDSDEDFEERIDEHKSHAKAKDVDYDQPNGSDLFPKDSGGEFVADACASFPYEQVNANSMQNDESQSANEDEKC